MKPWICALALTLSAGAAGAQQTPPAADPALKAPRVSQATTAVVSKPVLSAKGAELILQAAAAEAASHQWAPSIAIVDDAGRLMAFKRMDGAPLGTIDVAQGKALTAVKFKLPTKVVQDMVTHGGAAMTTIAGITAVTGGYPIEVNGQVAGAIGVSGGFGDEDDRTAMAGLAAGPH